MSHTWRLGSDLGKEGVSNTPLGRDERRGYLTPAKSQQSPWGRAEAPLWAMVPARPAGFLVCRPGVMTAADGSCDALCTGSEARRTSIRHPVSQTD